MPSSSITKRALAQALKTLMAERAFDRLSVGDICAACGMSRKSFYYHFKDKYDLVSWIFRTEFIDRIPSVGYESMWSFLDALCTYFYREQIFYRGAVQIQGQNSFRACFCEMMQPFIGLYLQRIFRQGESSAFAQTFLADALLTSLVRWLSDGVRMPPADYLAELQRLFVGLARQTLAELGEAEDGASPSRKQ